MRQEIDEILRVGTENERSRRTEWKKLTIGRAVIQLCLQAEPPCLCTFETCSGAFEIFRGRKERKKVNNIFHSFFILWTRQCEKTQIYSNAVIRFFFVSPFFPSSSFFRIPGICRKMSEPPLPSARRQLLLAKYGPIVITPFYFGFSTHVLAPNSFARYE